MGRLLLLSSLLHDHGPASECRLDRQVGRLPQGVRFMETVWCQVRRSNRCPQA
jgi:hypothetical protein